MARTEEIPAFDFSELTFKVKMNSSDDEDAMLGGRALHILQEAINMITSLIGKAGNFDDYPRLATVTETGC